MAATRLVRGAFRRLRPELLHPQPVSSLQPERLYAYLDALWQRRQLDGAVVEIGCWLCGTAVVASRMLDRLGCRKDYVCVDTFSGFVPAQFESDRRALGVPAADRKRFSETSLSMVERLLRHWHADQLLILVGDDICRMPPALLPKRIAVCLLDVDLAEPVYQGLRRVVPRLVPGGIVLVDDCPENTSWAGARVGYRHWCAEAGVAESYRFGFGVVEAAVPAAASLTAVGTAS